MACAHYSGKLPSFSIVRNVEGVVQHYLHRLLLKDQFHLFKLRVVCSCTFNHLKSQAAECVPTRSGEQAAGKGPGGLQAPPLGIPSFPPTPHQVCPGHRASLVSTSQTTPGIFFGQMTCDAFLVPSFKIQTFD